MTTQEKIRRILDENYSQDFRNKHTAGEIYHEVVEPLEDLSKALKFTIDKLLEEIQAKEKLLNLYKERNPGLIVNK